MDTKKRIDGTFGPFTFGYPHLTSPDTEGKFADSKYKVDGIGAPTDKAMVAVETALKAAAKELGVKLKGANLPLTAEKAKQDGSDKKVPTGNRVFRAKSKFAPGIVDASGSPIPAKKLAKLKIGAGSTGLIQGFFSAYTMTAKERVDGELVEVTIEGISFTLVGIQLLSVAAGQGTASFGAYEGGGYIADDGDDGDDMDDAPEAADEDDGDDGELDI